MVLWKALPAQGGGVVFPGEIRNAGKDPVPGHQSQPHAGGQGLFGGIKLLPVIDLAQVHEAGDDGSELLPGVCTPRQGFTGGPGFGNIPAEALQEPGPAAQGFRQAHGQGGEGQVQGEPLVPQQGMDGLELALLGELGGGHGDGGIPQGGVQVTQSGLHGSGQLQEGRRILITEGLLRGEGVPGGQIEEDAAVLPQGVLRRLPRHGLADGDPAPGQDHGPLLGRGLLRGADGPDAVGLAPGAAEEGPLLINAAQGVFLQGGDAPVGPEGGDPQQPVPHADGPALSRMGDQHRGQELHMPKPVAFRGEIQEVPPGEICLLHGPDLRGIPHGGKDEIGVPIGGVREKGDLQTAVGADVDAHPLHGGADGKGDPGIGGDAQHDGAEQQQDRPDPQLFGSPDASLFRAVLPLFDRIYIVWISIYWETKEQLIESDPS